jgi:hypothetical protein
MISRIRWFLACLTLVLVVDIAQGVNGEHQAPTGLVPAKGVNGLG